MRAIVLPKTGPAENLTYRPDWPEAPLQPGYVRVRVQAAGVCYRDVVDRRGGFPFMKLPVVPGHEFAGEVVEMGEGVTRVAVGDRVVNLHRAPCGECEYCRMGQEPRCLRSLYMFGHTADGGYAETVLAPEGCLVKLPDELEVERSCFLACTAAVALRGMETRGGLKSGETLLVTGASGGVGLHAVQVGKALGARVVAVTSSEEKAATLTEYGADDVIVSKDLAFHKEVKARTNGGVHVVLDCVGIPTMNASVRSVRPMGRVVVVGNVTVGRGEVNPGYLILNEISVGGSSACSRSDLERVLAWVKEGKVRPVLDEVLPLERAVDAHRRLEEKSVVGRLVLRP